MVGTPLWSGTGIVAAPVLGTWRALIAIVPELSALDRDLVLRLDAPRTFTVRLGDPPVATTHVDVDPVRCEIGQQGGWWYRGAVRLTAHPDGSQVTRTISNIASARSAWLVRLVHRQDPAQLRAAHDALLAALGERLGCGHTSTAP
jgi:hypothetical protein